MNRNFILGKEIEQFCVQGVFPEQIQIAYVFHRPVNIGFTGFDSKGAVFALDCGI
jgi:hypothetical protein